MMILPTRLKVVGLAVWLYGGVMMEDLVQYRPLTRYYLFLLFSFLLVQIIGLSVVIGYDFSTFDLSLYLFIGVCIPFFLSFLGYYLSWRAKRTNIEYHPFKWKFETIPLRLEDAGRLSRAYRKKYGRIVAVPYLWYYYTPIILTIILIIFPFYTIFVDSTFRSFVPLSYILLTNLIFTVSVLGGWRSTSTEASHDFRLPLLHETLKLAHTQSKVEGISHVRIVLEKAEHQGYVVYRNPRVVIRVSGIEKGSYIESWTEEFGSVDKMMIRILESDERPEVVWWWQNLDRWFRKYIGESDESYYVKNPVPSNIEELGVKDVRLVTQNAVAILILEWLKVREPHEHLLEILDALGVEPQSS